MPGDGSDRSKGSVAKGRRYPIGSTVDIDDLAGELHSTLASLRPTEPISWLPAVNGWLVTGYRLAVEILRNSGRFTVDDPRFTTAQVVGPSMLSTDGPAHDAHRRPFEPLFRRAQVSAVEQRIVRLANDLIDDFEHVGRAELRSRLAAPLAVRVIADFLGLYDANTKRTETESTLLDCYRRIVASVVGLTVGQPTSQAGQLAMAELSSVIDRALSSQESALRRVIAADSEMTGPRLHANVAVILFGAIETSEAMTANAIHHLLTNPEVGHRLSEDRIDVDLVVNESLRLEPAAATVDRYATAAVTVPADDNALGATIDKGDLVMVSLAGANRDPALFEDPNRFDPDRARVGQHLTVARGPHVCLGLHLARLQTAVALRTLFQRLPGLQLDKAASQPPRGLIFRKPEQVIARW